MTYARDTKVPIDRSKVEIGELFRRYGADDIASGENLRTGDSWVAFSLRRRGFKIVLTMPDRADFATTPTGRTRDRATQTAQWEQACRQRWRAMVLWVKANLEAVDSGIITLEQAFLASMMLPDGSRVEDWLVPQINVAYESKRMPPMLMAGGHGDSP